MKINIYNTNKKYDIIYADPPWEYRDRKPMNKPGAKDKYPTQSIEWLCSLPVKKIANDNSVLFMWVTMPQLDVCFDIIEAWGFKYRTNGFTWIKRYPESFGYFIGLGHWTRANAELCLLAAKGKPQRKSASVSSIIEEVREEHSKKPDIVRDKIVELMGDLPRIELFARQEAAGWDCWGNEV